MLFASQVRQWECKKCRHQILRATPASPLFIVMLAGIGTAILDPALIKAGWSISGWMWVVIPAALGLLALAFVILTDYIKNLVLPLPNVCPHCYDEMVLTLGGFSHSLFPSLQEIIDLVLFLAIIIAVRWWFTNEAFALILPMETLVKYG